MAWNQESQKEVPESESCRADRLPKNASRFEHPCKICFSTSILDLPPGTLATSPLFRHKLSKQQPPDQWFTSCLDWHPKHPSVLQHSPHGLSSSLSFSLCAMLHRCAGSQFFASLRGAVRWPNSESCDQGSASSAVHAFDCSDQLHSGGEIIVE